METSMGSTIEKIKLQEHDKETKLREKRRIEEALASTSRNLREATSCTAKLKEEFLNVTVRADAVNAELSIEQTRRCALAAQLESSTKELQLLKAEANQGILKVWKLRNLLCDKVQNTSDHCDVWALFTKPKYIEHTTAPKKCIGDTARKESEQEGILKCALRKRQTLVAERNRLLNEPDSGDEFIRIKNALRYTEEMADQLRQ